MVRWIRYHHFLATNDVDAGTQALETGGTLANGAAVEVVDVGRSLWRNGDVSYAIGYGFDKQKAFTQQAAGVPVNALGEVEDGRACRSACEDTVGAPHTDGVSGFQNVAVCQDDS